MVKKIFLLLLVLVLLSSFTYASSECDGSFELCFPMNESSGINIKSVNESLNFTLSGFQDDRVGYIGQGQFFRNADTYVEADKSFGVSPQSVNFWANITGGADATTIIFSGASGNLRWDVDGADTTRFKYYTNDLGGVVTCTSGSNTYKTNVWQMHSYTYDGVGTHSFYINGSLQCQASNGDIVQGTSKIWVGYSSATYRVDGTWDEVKFFDTNLSSDEINNLFLFNDVIPPVAVSNFSITNLNVWNGSFVSNFNVTLQSGVTLLNFTTNSSNLTTSILSNDSRFFNITVFKTGYFDNTSLNYNVSSDYSGSLFQSMISVGFNFSSGDLIVTPINLTSLDTGEFFNVTGGSQLIFPNEGINNFSVRCDNEIFRPFTFMLNVSALDNFSVFFVVNETQNIITFLDANSSSPIDNASITVGFPSGFSLDLNTNASGQISFSYIQNDSLEFGDYSYYFDKIGYVNITLSDFINESNIPHSRTYNLSRAKLNIFIYDRVTRALLSGVNVSVAFIGLFNETTDTGSIVKDNLTIVGGDYLIYASAEDYKTSIRSLTFTNQEEFTLEFYLLNLSEGNAGTLFVTTKDSFFRDITGAKVDLLEYIPSSLSYVSVDSCVSNVNAECSFAVELNTKVYYIRATSVIDGTVFVAETSRNGEIFTVNNDVRNLIFFTRGSFSISTSTNLIYSPTESFVNNVSSISLDFFTSDGTSKEVCIEYFVLDDNNDWVSVTGDTYCLFSSNAIQNIDVDVTLNRSNSYEARILVREGFDNVLVSYSYPSFSSASEVFDSDFKSVIIMILWVFALAYSLHQKNISLFFFLGILVSWFEVIFFPIFSIVAISVFKTIICVFAMYVARKKEAFQ